MHKKDLHAMFNGYEKEEALVQEDINILGMNKPDAEAGNTTVRDKSDRIKKKSPMSTSLQMWTKTRKILQNKINNAKKS